ncbi:MYC2 transcription factor [Artemisia annua]|uniref:MYC2 transcription factor n=1 Tax=Artemisia annua TaxID=35608 RepID=A0A2U1MZ73_ARTAN|nr:MYC2 transcription factor [Artemisia annua]
MKGEVNKPKTVQYVTSFAEQEHREKVLRELNSLISSSQSKENEIGDEESFVNGHGFPGQDEDVDE